MLVFIYPTFPRGACRQRAASVLVAVSFDFEALQDAYPVEI